MGQGAREAQRKGPSAAEATYASFMSSKLTRDLHLKIWSLYLFFIGGSVPVPRSASELSYAYGSLCVEPAAPEFSLQASCNL